MLAEGLNYLPKQNFEVSHAGVAPVPRLGLLAEPIQGGYSKLISHCLEVQGANSDMIAFGYGPTLALILFAEGLAEQKHAGRA